MENNQNENVKKDEILEESDAYKVDEETNKIENQENLDNEETVSELEELKEEPEDEGPYVKLSVKYDYKTLKYYNVFSIVYQKHFNILYIALAALCLGYAVFQVFYTIIPTIQAAQENGEAISWTVFLIPVLFLIFAAYAIYSFFSYEKGIDRNLTLHFNNTNKITTIETKINHKGIYIVSSNYEGESFKYEWPYITKICEIPQYYYFYVGKQPIIVPKDENCVLEGDLATLRAIVDEQAKIKPYKKVDKDIVKKPITYVHPSELDEMQKNSIEVEEVQSQEEKTEE